MRGDGRELTFRPWRRLERHKGRRAKLLALVVLDVLESRHQERVCSQSCNQVNSLGSATHTTASFSLQRRVQTAEEVRTL